MEFMQWAVGMSFKALRTKWNVREKHKEHSYGTNWPHSGCYC